MAENPLRLFILRLLKSSVSYHLCRKKCLKVTSGSNYLPSKNNLNTPIPKLRIIAGKWRSRVITFQPADGLRPTGDRIRETLFNWLSTTIDGARCIDVFAGSGALSFEALLSRRFSMHLPRTARGQLLKTYIKMLLHCELKILTLCRPTASIFYSTAHRISPFI